MEDMDIPLPPRAPSPLYSPTSPTSDHEEDKSAAAEAVAKAAALYVCGAPASACGCYAFKRLRRLEWACAIHL